MQNSKFLRLYRTLESSECDAFRKYLHRRYCQEKAALRVHDYLYELAPDFSDAAALESDAVASRLFPTTRKAATKRPAARSQLTNALSDLYAWLRDFLLLGMLKRESLEGEFLWLAVLRERGLIDDFERGAVRTLDRQREASKSTVTAHLREVTAAYYFYFESNRANTVEDLEKIYPVTRAIDLYYVVSRLKMACEIANANHVYAAKLDASLEPWVLNFAATVPAEEQPLLKLYYAVYQLLVNDPGADYDYAEGLLLSHAVKIDREELKTHYGWLQNYLIRKTAIDMQGYFPRQFSLNKLAMEIGILPAKNTITTAAFLNIVNSASFCKEFAWAYKFIELQGPLVQSKNLATTLKLARFTVLFGEGKYAELLPQLHEADYTESSEAIRARSLKLICLYETATEEIDVLEYAQRLQVFLRRLRTRRRGLVQAAKNFLQLILLLARKTTAKKVLQEKIENTKPLIFQTWLLEKGQSYRKKYTSR